jgi:hypothetical protein
MKSSEPIRASSKYACLTCTRSLDLSKSGRGRSVDCSAPGAHEYLWPCTRAQVLSFMHPRKAQTVTPKTSALTATVPWRLAGSPSSAPPLYNLVL